MTARTDHAEAPVFRFKCATCDEWHEGMPSFHTSAPLHFFAVPDDEREDRCFLGTDDCVIDDRYFFMRGCLEIPVQGAAQPFVWGVWIALEEPSFDIFIDSFHEPKRSHRGPLYGWLADRLPLYPDTESLKVRAHIRDDGIRPFIELEPTEHPLALEQRHGISLDRLAEIYAACMHRAPPGSGQPTEA